MNRIQSVFGVVRPRAFVCGLLLVVAGCGGPKDGETSPEIARTQEEASSAWAKAKASGTDKRKAPSSPSNPGGRGYVNRPGS